ncbi:hypothetical protein MCAP1_003474 [Malassezia caprae]|uniref:Uncharacterized protein n=1 Tax=Malassezia caprae TaxID=1381934 RepID=A0AAF0EBB7_9BASI|nr:hypothetical protein MCAP1_003474 [Malassezia caprae]
MSTDGRAAPSFTPPVGYRACGLDDMGSMSDKELWVLRVPEGVDAASLDGVTIPLEALDEHGVLASVEVPGDDTYDVLVATQTTAERVNEGPSQLIEMAGPSDDRVRLDREFLRTDKSAGVASELVSVSALVPRKGSLRLAPITHRLYMARQAPRAAHKDAAPVARTRAQPWDRLKGIFRPTGSQSAHAPRKEADKKRKKDAEEPKKKKKQKQ